MKNMEKNSAGSFLVQFLIGQSATSGSLLKKNILGIDTNCHGIRMDAYIEELPETSLCDAEISSDVYDIEPDNGSDRHLLLLCGKSCKKTVPFRIFPRL